MILHVSPGLVSRGGVPYLYLELVGGRQPDFTLSVVKDADQGGDAGIDADAAKRPHALPPRITEAEKSAHEAFVEKLGENALWRT